MSPDQEGLPLMVFAFTGARVFDGRAFTGDRYVMVDGRRIVAITHTAPTGDVRTIDLGGGILAPGFIDVQVNGGGGALLNATPDAAAVTRIAKAHRKYGTTSLLPTVITDAPEVLERAIAAVRVARAGGVAEVLGIHIEGPFLDVARKGAHDAAFIRPMTVADAERIAAADCGAVMVTVAPNRVSPELIRRLSRQGVLVSLGHADASFADARLALDAGARAFTHLFNAMSQLTPREPGMVGAALADRDSYVGVIADGHHVHGAALRIAIALKPDRVMLVSDAMPTVAGGPDTFKLQGRTVTHRHGRLELADGTLAGSALTMDAAVRHCVHTLGLDLSMCLAMATSNPALFLGRGHDLGRIAAGALANLVHLDDSLQVVNTWVEGS